DMVQRQRAVELRADGQRESGNRTVVRRGQGADRAGVLGDARRLGRAVLLRRPGRGRRRDGELEAAGDHPRHELLHDALRWVVRVSASGATRTKASVVRDQALIDRELESDQGLTT